MYLPILSKNSTIVIFVKNTFSQDGHLKTHMLAHTRHIHSLIQEIKAAQCSSASLSRDHLKVPDLMINISYPIDDNISDITSEIKEEMDELDASVICSDNISDIRPSLSLVI